MKILKYSLYIVVIFIGAFAYYAPASIIQNFLPANISATGISGTLWNGNAQTIIIDRVAIQNTKWEADPVRLLMGIIKANVSINSNNIQGQFNTSYSGSALKTKDIALIGDLSLLAPYFEQFGLTISGLFDASFNNLDIKNGVPSYVDGILQIYDVSILGLIPLNLGDVTSVFSKDTNDLIVNLDNTNGEIDLSGTIKINSNGKYVANLVLKRNKETSDQVIQTIQLMGNKINEDTVKLVYSGHLRI